MNDPLITSAVGPLELSEKKMLQIARRRLTCALKAKKILETERAQYRAGLRVIKWAKRFIEHESHWSKTHLSLAVKAYEKEVNPSGRPGGPSLP